MPATGFVPASDDAVLPAPRRAASALPVPRALLFFLSHQDSYRRPLFSPHEIFCGPDAETRPAAVNRPAAFRTPVGSFDAGDILASLSAAERPELVIVKADATARNFPRNLARLGCPRVLLVGDTHHLRDPLQTVIRYAREEAFDFIILDHTRHHAPWFFDAGLKNVFWLPALDYGFLPRALLPAPKRPLTFVGQTGAHHPWRRHVLAQLRAAGLPLETLSGPLSATADIYADSQITLNISLNGDLNLRVFEALAAGGFLLTDELPASSGLPLLFTPGEHLDTWRTPDELVEKIRHYQDRPDDVRRLRTAGQAEIICAHHPRIKLREFYDLVFSGAVNPRYALAAPARQQFSGAGPSSPATPAAAPLPAYELLQSLHQAAERVLVFCPVAQVAEVSALVALPRLQVHPVSALGEATADPLATPPPGRLPEHHVLWWPEPAGTDSHTADLVAALAHFRGRHIVAPAAAGETLAAWGFAAARPGIFDFADASAWLRSISRSPAVCSTTRLALLLAAADRAEDALTIAELAGQMENGPFYKEALQRAIYLDRNCQPALLQLASLSLELAEPAAAAVLLGEAARVAPLAPEIDALRAGLLADHAALPEIADYLAKTGQRGPVPATAPRRILLVTNLFPPEELGGYGRMMWEFAHGLRARGHEVRIVCGHAAYLRQPPTAEESALERHVSRELALLGEWREGAARPAGRPDQLARLAAQNARRTVSAALAFGADLVLLGNLDFLGAELLHAALAAGFPVLHALANATPGYAPAAQPVAPGYWVTPCSDWNGEAFRRAGYTPARIETLHPGARLENFHRYFFPDTRRLRLAYASLVMPYKGAHVLVDALARLHQAGISFTAEIAGGSTDAAFLQKLKDFCAATGLAGRVKFTGFLDRHGLAALFARSNVLVFPSQFEEPFGISQVEALAAGLVVVSSGTGGAAEVIRDGVDGLLFPAPDAEALAQRLASLARDSRLFQTLQHQGRARAQNFSVAAAVAGIERLADGLCGRPALRISA